MFPGVQGGPLMHIIAAKAVCFKEALEPAFADYQRQIVANAQAAGARRCRTPGFRLVSGGTDNHLMLVDVFSKGLTGKVAEAALGKAGITVNKNAIPFDQNPPMVASGIRIGTPAVTTPRHARAGDGRDRRAHRARARVAGRRRRARRRCGSKSRGCAGSSRCTRSGKPGTRRRDAPDARSRPRSRRTGRLRWRCPASRRAPASSRWPTPSPRSSPTAACCSPRPGTGTGKTLAYLVPAILSRQRVLVSTGTKNLQEQIFFKDLPVLRDVARRAVHRHLHEGARQLSLPASLRRVASEGGTGAVARVHAATSRSTSA